MEIFGRRRGRVLYLGGWKYFKKGVELTRGVGKKRGFDPQRNFAMTVNM